MCSLTMTQPYKAMLLNVFILWLQTEPFMKNIESFYSHSLSDVKMCRRWSVSGYYITDCDNKWTNSSEMSVGLRKLTVILNKIINKALASWAGRIINSTGLSGSAVHITSSRNVNVLRPPRLKKKVFPPRWLSVPSLSPSSSTSEWGRWASL